jgi:exosortase
VVEPHLRRIALAAGLALLALAYQPLLASALSLPSAHRVEMWLFRPSQLPAPFVLGLSGWLWWRRRDRLRAAPARSSWPLAGSLALLSAAAYAWAHLTGSLDLLWPSLAATLLAWASAARGRAGARAALLPALVLLLGVAIPSPLRHEIVWRLQLATANAASWLLAAVGRDFIREGVILRDAAHSFHVIDGCSGLQGIATLIAAAVVVRELLALPGWRAALVLAFAPVLGFALNAVRIAYIAGSPDPEAYAGLQGDHTPQGVALLAVGAALLYGFARLLSPRAAPAPAPAARAAEPASRASAFAAAALLVLLALLGGTLTPFPGGRAAAGRPALSEAGAGWSSERLIADPYYLPPNAAQHSLYRRYQRGDETPPDLVDVLIAVESNELADTSELLSAKFAWPGPEWNVESRHETRLWELGGVDADLAIAARGTGPERAVVYRWRVRDEGLLRESLRALLALDASPLRRAQPRTVVRLVAFAPFDDSLAIARAKRRLDRFISVFRDELRAL